MAETIQFKVNDHVKLVNSANKDQEGTVLYVGQLEGKEGVWIGVELTVPKGSHNGAFNDKQYFTCREGHGLFVREKHLQLIESKQPSLPKARQQEQAPTPPPQDKIDKPVEKKVITKTMVPSSSTSTTGSKTTLGGVSTAVKAAKTISDKSTTSASTKISSSSSLQASQTSKPSADQSQAIKQLEEALSYKDSEINMQKEELERKDDQLNEFTQRIGSLQNENDTQLQQISNLKEQYAKLEEQLKKEQQKYSDIHTKMLQQTEDYSKLEEECEVLHQSLKLAEESESLVEGLTIDKENLEHKLEELKETLFSKEQEIKKLHEEKQLAEIELEEAMKGVIPDGQSVSGDSINADLMKSNARLKQAVQLLNDQFEEEKIEFLEKMIDLQGKLESLPTLETKINELESKIQDQQDQIKKKNDDIEELKERLDEQSEAVEMVENLTEQNQELEDKITALKKEIKSFKEIKLVNEELFENYDLTIKDMQDQINQLEYQLYEQKRFVQEKEEQLGEQEKTIEKLKEKAKIYKEQSESMKLEASETAASQSSTQGKQGTSIQKLLESQQELFQEKREIYKQYLDSLIQSINIKVESKCRSQVYLSCIPDQITNKINAEGIKVLINISKNIKKTNLLQQELYSYLTRHTDQIIKEENINIYLWITQLIEQTNLFIYYLRRFETLISNAQTEDEVVALVKSGSNSSFVAGGLFIELILKQLMDDNVSPKVALDPIVTANNKLKEETFTVREDLELKMSYIEIQKNIGLIRVQLICKLFLNKYINGSNCDILFNTLEKRIFEFSKNIETGVILNNLKISKLVECNTALNTLFDSIQDEKIGNFFQSVKTDMKEDIDTKEESNEEKEERESIQQFRKVISDIANLLSSLNADADQKLQQAQVSKQNDIVQNNSYWQNIIHQVKETIENIDNTIQSEKKLTEELTASKSKGIQQEQEIENLTKIKQTLEQRVVKLQITSEKVTVLEAEKKRYQEKEKSFKDASDIIQKELESIKKKYKESQEENRNLNSVVRTSIPKNTSGPVLQLKHSLSKNLGDTPKSGSRQSIMFAQQLDEENYDLVRYYETENNILRSKHLKDKIKTLITESSNLKLFKKLKEKGNNENQISFLSQQINKANSIHDNGLRLLASKQVVDLSELKNKNLAQKDENIKQYLKKEHTQLEALKYEAFKICSEVSKKVQKSKTSFKQRIDIPTNTSSELSNLKKLGSIQFNSDSAQPCSITKLTISLNNWEKIRQVF